MLRWMIGHEDRIRNECIRKKVGTPLSRKLVEVIVRRVAQMEGNPMGRGRGRPRKIIGKTIKKIRFKGFVYRHYL